MEELRTKIGRLVDLIAFEKADYTNQLIPVSYSRRQSSADQCNKQ